MLAQKPLCRLCECPTADGYVIASQVDRFKLRKWAMNIMNLSESDENLPAEVDVDDLICYFCLWQAEFADLSGDESVAWWPKNLDLDETAKELRRNYSKGNVEQCWVQLKELDVPTKPVVVSQLKPFEEIVITTKLEKEESEEDTSVKWTEKPADKRRLCMFCGALVSKMTDHIKRNHKHVVRCNIRKCGAYFHSAQEMERHMRDLHEKAKVLPKIACAFCPHSNNGMVGFRYHMKTKHPEYKQSCRVFNCIFYFKSEAEFERHYAEVHQQEMDGKAFKCQHCPYRSDNSKNLRRHVALKHLPKTIKCGLCSRMFATQLALNVHFGAAHTFKVCKACDMEVASKIMESHFTVKTCRRCGKKLNCSSLLRLHRIVCLLNLLKCHHCEATFKLKTLLISHIIRQHRFRRRKKIKFFELTAAQNSVS